jgi:dephospho-CoA kinase
MRVIGLTGSIACGKSTVAEHLRSRGVPVLDADQIAREVVLPGSPALEELRASFGDAILAKNGTLDRGALAAVVFGNDERLRMLNAITHKRIWARAAERIADLATQGEELAVWEAALLIESGSADMFRPLIVVACSPEVQLERLMKRDRCSLSDAQSRISAQMSSGEKVKRADFIIQNDGDIEGVAHQTDHVLGTLCDQLGVPQDRFGLA